MKTEILKLGGLVLSVSLLASCGQRNVSNANGRFAGNIVGGSTMTTDQQKEAGVVGLVIVTDEGTGTCTGSLIDKRIVLTAAHCMAGNIQSLIVVFNNNIEEATADSVRAALTGRQHEGFMPSPSSWNDIALLKLRADAPADFKLARLPSAATNAALKIGVNLTQMGFGRTVADKSSTDGGYGLLKSVDGIAILKKSADEKELYLNEENKGSCNGDSGGPAFVKDADGKLTQVGINSRGTSPKSCIGVGIYTNVASHLDWIKTTSAELLALPDQNPAETPAHSTEEEPQVPNPSPAPGADTSI